MSGEFAERHVEELAARIVELERQLEEARERIGELWRTLVKTEARNVELEDEIAELRAGDDW